MAEDFRLLAHRAGLVLWRNNSGAARDPSGRQVRYGLGNDSAELCRERASSDWIGMAPSGRLLAVEQKPPGWSYAGTPRERAQLNFINEVKRRGGVAGFATCWEDVLLLLHAAGENLRRRRRADLEAPITYRKRK